MKSTSNWIPRWAVNTTFILGVILSLVGFSAPAQGQSCDSNDPPGCFDLDYIPGGSDCDTLTYQLVITNTIFNNSGTCVGSGSSTNCDEIESLILPIPCTSDPFDNVISVSLNGSALPSGDLLCVGGFLKLDNGESGSNDVLFTDPGGSACNTAIYEITVELIECMCSEPGTAVSEEQDDSDCTNNHSTTGVATCECGDATIDGPLPSGPEDCESDAECDSGFECNDCRCTTIGGSFCGEIPTDVVIMIDRTGSVGHGIGFPNNPDDNDPTDELKTEGEAVNALLQLIKDDPANPEVNVAVGRFPGETDGSPTDALFLTDGDGTCNDGLCFFSGDADLTDLQARITNHFIDHNHTDYQSSAGNTDLQNANKTAQNGFIHGPNSPNKIYILLSDGDPNRPVLGTADADALESALAMDVLGVHRITIAYDASGDDTDVTFNGGNGGAGDGNPQSETVIGDRINRELMAAMASFANNDLPGGVPGCLGDPLTTADDACTDDEEDDENDDEDDFFITATGAGGDLVTIFNVIKEAIDCPNINACQSQDCNPDTNMCVPNPPEDNCIPCGPELPPCPDDACTTPSCVEGECVFTQDTCDDDLVCTVSQCDSQAGCSHTPVICEEDTNVCTTATCTEPSGCGFTNNTHSESCYTGPAETNGVGICHGGTKTCSNGSFGPCVGQVLPGTEICNGLDDDCDGSVDEGFNLGTVCDGGDADLCDEGTLICNGDGSGTTCTDPNDNDPDICDGQDNDCNPSTPDGTNDPGLGQACDGTDPDFCPEGVQICQGGTLTCNDPNTPNPEVCDGLDNDCNGLTPDGSGEPTLGNSCDGADDDLCEEGKIVCESATLTCDDPNDADPELCDGDDNDCDPSSDDGADEPTLGDDCDGTDEDLCDEGKIVCEDGELACDDPNDPDPELCDGLDNDCDGDTDEGFNLGQACDGDDEDLCNEGVLVCNRDGGTSCDDPNDDDPEVCDGNDNDCDPSSADGADEASLGDACDGTDADLCPEGSIVCEGGALSCNDTNDNDPEICDGNDNDCNPSTPDGMAEPTLGDACDGTDLDLCPEGVIVCQNGGLTCNDPNDADPELCDGLDNDCNGQTPDGANEPTLGNACDGRDDDLCEEGKIVCESATLTCDDPNDADPELCDGDDNDCDPSSADGADEPTLGDDCDGTDDDLCDEGNIVCEDGDLSCDDPNDADPEICDGLDNDCDGSTDEGFDLGNECDGNDEDLCPEGKLVCNPEGGASCDDPNDSDPEICDGKDNDCDPSTADGGDEPTLGNDCDGTDDDLCDEGKIVCEGGSLTCNDPNDADPEICDGLDNDCDEQTDEGFDVGTECDGDDTDLCPEGKIVCNPNGGASCNDPNDADPEVCDGEDNDCNSDTSDGANEETLGDDCDGEDADQCNEGEIVCIEGDLVCNDPNDEDPEVCDGQDNDCDEQTDEGFNLGQVCTVGTGACEREGTLVCTDDGQGSECNVDPGEPSEEVCDGIDNDCDESVDEGGGLLCDDDNPCTDDACNGAEGCQNTENTSCEPPPCPDQDNDEICDDVDNCPENSNTDQADEDNDGVGDECDSDDSTQIPPNVLCISGGTELTGDGPAGVCAKGVGCGNQLVDGAVYHGAFLVWMVLGLALPYGLLRRRVAVRKQ